MYFAKVAGALGLLAVLIAGGAHGAMAATAYQPNQITATVLRPNLPVTTQVVVRTPPANPKAHIAIIVMHAFGGSANNAACTAMAQRGYTTLCIDHTYSGHQFDYKGYEDHAPALSAAVNHLRNNVPGVTKIVLLGHSMGGPLMAFYANVSENGAAICQRPERIIACVTTNLVDAQGRNKLPPIDGVILSDTHPGDAIATFTYVDPAITDPASPGKRDPQLDMFAAANGYPGDAQAGAPTYRGANYSTDFSNRFFDAQAARNAQIMKQAQDALARIKAGDKSVYPDDALIVVPGAEGAARLLQADLDLWKCTKRAHTFLTRDGRTEMSPGPICSVRLPSASLEGANSVNTVIHVPARVWLGSRAIRTNGPYRQTLDGITGIDWDSSNTSTLTNMKTVTKPLLMISHGAHYFMAPDEMIFDAAKSADKTFVVLEGATHPGTPCEECATARGLPKDYFGDTMTRRHDFLDEWLAKRF